jgi:hypothetical protein
VRQTIDTWSLGCVFSIAATWIVFGVPGIRQFTKLRERAIKENSKEQGDYFHDGTDVLTDVRNWHDVLRSTLRKTDKITERVLDLIDGKMLLGSADERITAKDLCTQLTQIVGESEAEAREKVPESIMQALLEVDEAAPWRFTDSATADRRTFLRLPATLSDGRKALKSWLSDIRMMKTTHRSEYLKSALGSQSGERNVDGPHADDNTKDGASPTGYVITPDVGLGITSTDSQHPPPQRTNTQASQNHSGHQRAASKSQTVFQAREELEKRESWREKVKLWRGTPKDEFLASHFHNRDIVSCPEKTCLAAF